MKKILIICSLPNDTFIYNISRWLKSKMDITIDIVHYARNPEQTCSMEYYDDVHYLEFKKGLLRAPAFRHFPQSKALLEWLKGKHYDIIHCQAAIQASVLSTDLKKHCDKLCLTFWGGEMETMRIMYSNALYKCYLKRFLKKVDLVMNSPIFNDRMTRSYPFLKGHTRPAYFGSVPLEKLFELIKSESKGESKSKLGIDDKKTTVLIGYSGKSIHNHLSIIKELSQIVRLKERLHLLAPMTRGGHASYIDEVSGALESSGYTYTLLRDQFLSDCAVARLRNATDITLQLSDYDGFSRSIVECMGAESILIYGNWLDYDQRLKEEGLAGIRIKGLKELGKTLTDILEHPQAYNEDCKKNSQNISKNNLWEYCISDWITAYSE